MIAAFDAPGLGWLRRHAQEVADVLICIALVGFTIPATFDPATGARGSWLSTILLPTVVLPIVVRRRAPLLAAAGLLAGSMLSALPTLDQFRITAAVPAALLVVYANGSRGDRREASAGLAFVVAAMVCLSLTDAGVRRSGDGALSAVAFTVPLCCGIWGAGRVAWSRDRLVARLVRSTAQLMEQREQTAAVAVEVERARLAAALDASAQERVRELVDLAQGAAAPDRFARIERLGRAALDELRELLGVLRSDERGERAPRPTLAQLDELLEAARAGGRIVVLRVEGTPQPLAAGLELAVCRAVQHTLGASSHDGSPITVRLRYLPAALECKVDGRYGSGATAAARLVAARERLEAYGARVGEGALLDAWIPTTLGV